MDHLPFAEASAVEKLRVEIDRAEKVIASKAPRALRDHAAVTARLLTIAAELLETPFNDYR